MVKQFYSIFVAVSVLFLLVGVGNTASRLEIVREDAMRVVGKYSFKVRGGGKQIRWTLDREEIAEDTTKTVAEAVARADGKRAEFDLTAKPNTETVYRVRAETDGATDEYEIRVFPAGAVSFFTYRSAGNPAVRTYLAAPPKIDKNTKNLIVMHGQKRDAAAYLESWREWANRENYIAAAPKFEEPAWEDSRSYNLGNLFENESGSKGAMKPPSQWTFTIVEEIYKKVRKDFRVKDNKFDIWGHSAGAQFVHRFLFFKPAAPVRTAIAANAGWFTLPELEAAFPYGWQNAQFNFSKTDVKNYTAKKLILMRGAGDTAIDDQVRTTPEANRQGANRFERTEFMFEIVKKINPRTAWRLIDVPDAAHEQQKMAQAAQEILNQNRRH